MKRETVVSSSISSIGYCAVRHVIEVKFRHGGAYEYLGVTAEDYAALLQSGSKGQWVNREIKTRFAYRRVGVRS